MAARSAAWLSRAFLAHGKWFSLLWLSLILYEVTGVWQRGQWGAPLPPLFWLALWGLIVGWLLSQMGGRALWRHGLGALAGGTMVIGAVAVTLPGEGWRGRVVEMMSRAEFWWEAAREGWSNSDSLILLLLLAAICWFLGYFSAWCLVWRKASWAVLASGGVILSGLFYVSQPATPFLLFLWFALMLILYVNLAPQDNPFGLSLLHHVGLLILAWFVILVAWLLPLSPGWLHNRDLWARVPPWREFTLGFQSLFPMLAAAPGPGALPSTYVVSFGNHLPFGGAVSFSGQLLFLVQTERPGYWRGNSYNVYTSQGWLSSERMPATASQAEAEGQGAFLLRQEVTQKVRLLVASDLLLAAGQPLRADQPSIAESLAPPVWTIPIGAEPVGAELPAEVRRIAQQIRQMAESGPLSLSQVSRSLPADFRGVGVEWQGSRVVALKIQRRPAPVADIAALRSPRLLMPPLQYTVTSSVSIATPDELRQSQAPLPVWVREQYLPLPTTLPERVRRLAAELTRDKENTYDKAVAIQNYLRQLTYSQDIAPPPPEADGVDYLLFVSKTGYSQYFASAMAVMLRSVGVPARLVAGFASDEYDRDKGVYRVKDGHAHGWVEVFFPEYGWVEFEPTPNRPPLRPESPLPQGPPGEPEPPQEAKNEFLENEFVPPTPLSSLAGSPRSFPVGLVALGLSLLLAIGVLLWWGVWSAKGGERELYEKMCRLARWARLPPQPWLTPLEYANRLSAAVPSGAGAVHLIAQCYAQWLYGKRGADEEGQEQLRAAWVELRGELLKRVLRPEWRAR